MPKRDRRKHTEPRCSHGTKIRFRSAAKARQARLEHRRVAALFIYECPNCGGWHLTSHPQPKDGKS